MQATYSYSIHTSIASYVRRPSPFKAKYISLAVVQTSNAPAYYMNVFLVYVCHSLNFAVFHVHVYSLRPIYSQIAHKLKCPTVKTISCRNHNVYSPNNVWMSGRVSISMHKTYWDGEIYGDLRVCMVYRVFTNVVVHFTATPQSFLYLPQAMLRLVCLNSK